MSYCIDTNCLIDLERQYPSTVFEGLWNNIYDLIDEGELFSVKDVLNEIKQEHDEFDPVVARWKDLPEFFIESGEDEEDILTEIMNNSDFEVFRNHAPDTGVWADPHIIACAESRSAIVVTNETLHKHPLRKIPYVCDVLSVRYMTLLDMMEHLGWKF
ncbi:MAG: DUF4411 family protein [Methanobacterium sp.]|nr:MAG: DUF4411 family protein [Methanobacterium sp.]